MKTYPIEYIISYARKSSKFYKNLYQNFGDNPKLTDLPLIDLDEFWGYMSKNKLDILTGEQMDGQLFKSGGTSGEPKYSPYTSDEWQTTCELGGFYLPKSGLKFGDKVANLFYGGGMYASFLFVYSIMQNSSQKPIVFNLAGQSEVEEIVESLVKLNCNVIAGLPSIIMKVIEHIKNNNIKGLVVDTIYYAGEPLQIDHREEISKVLERKVDFRSASLAGNDYGIIAYFSKDCGFNEHRVMDLACHFEIIDEETSEVITEEGRPGNIYITSYSRLLMPLIRYPIGDMGMYTEPTGGNDRKFKLLGRVDSSARVGIVTFYKSDISRILGQMHIHIKAYQAVIDHYDKKDGLTIKIVSDDGNDDISSLIIEKVYKERSLFVDAINSNLIWPIKIKWCSINDLEYNKRTGKLKNIIDNRLG